MPLFNSGKLSDIHPTEKQDEDPSFHFSFFFIPPSPSTLLQPATLRRWYYQRQRQPHTMLSLRPAISSTLSRNSSRRSVVFACSRRQRAYLSSATTTNNVTTSSSRSRDVAFGIAGGFVITTVGGIAYINNHVGGSDGLLRTVSFYSLAIVSNHLFHSAHIRGQISPNFFYHFILSFNTSQSISSIDYTC